MIDSSSFSLSHHGTMFVYPLQVRLYKLFVSSTDSHRLTKKKEVIFTREWIIQQLSSQGYKPRAIEQEIERSLYAAILTQECPKLNLMYRLTSWGRSLIDNLFNEAPWQPRQFILKVARRGDDSYQLIVRDTTFLSLALRDSLAENGFKEHPVYELRRSKVRKTEIPNIIDKLLIQLNNGGSPFWHSRGHDNCATTLSLISRFGKNYKSINDQYVHYALPYHYEWDASDVFDALCRATIDVGQRPVEWRGKSFVQDEIFSQVDKHTVHKIPLHRKQHGFQYLLDTGFVRAAASVGQYTLTGQGATWLETYFRVVDENFSHLDLTLRRIDNGAFWIRAANSTYFPPSVRSILRSKGAQETPEWFFLNHIAQDRLLSLISEMVPCLTIWKKNANKSKTFKLG